MKVHLFSTLLLASYCSALDLICTAPFGRIGFLPALDCTKFYVCNWLTILERSCPLGLHWNQRANICDQPSAAGCIGGTTVTTPTTPTVTSTGTTPTTPTETSTQASTTALEEVEEEAEETTDETTEETPVVFTCPPGDGPDLFPHESDCTKFYSCERGIKTEMNCPQGLFFNPVIFKCDDPRETNCVVGSTNTTGNTTEGTTDDTTDGPTDEPTDGSTDESTDETPEVVVCPPGDGPDLLSHESDCMKFYSCERGIKTEMSCPQGLFFNPAISRCDNPEFFVNTNCERFPNTTPVVVPT